MHTGLETERKYDVPSGFQFPELTGAAAVASLAPPVEHRLDATYYDTPGLRLALSRVTLRHRSGGEDPGWHLKQPADREARTETRTAGDDPDRPPATLVNRIRDLVDDLPLQPVARVRTRRVERSVLGPDGDLLARIADDLVSSHAPGNDLVVQQWRELEVELESGDEALLDAIEAALRAAGAQPARSPSKLARALRDRLPAEVTTTRAAAPAGGPARRDTPLTAYLWAQYDAFIRHEAGARAGEAAAVHKLRVATRRLRSTLRTFRPLLDPDRTTGLGSELKWLATTLGEVRDGQVITERLTSEVAQLPEELAIGPVAARIRQRLASRTARAREVLAAALASDRYVRLREAVAQLAAGGEAGTASPKQLHRRARKALRRADRRLAAADQPAAALTAEPAPAIATYSQKLHEARKAYKRARYGVEVLTPIAGKSASTLVSRLTALQDLLGAHQDSITGRELLRSFGMQAHLDGENAFTYGLLYAGEKHRAERSLAELPAARRRAGRRKVRAWLDHPTNPRK